MGSLSDNELPAEAYKLAKEYHLGEPLKTYNAFGERPEMPWWYKLLRTSMLLSVVLLLLSCVLSSGHIVEIQISLFVAMVAMISIMSIVFWFAPGVPHYSLYVCDKGVVRTHRRTDASEVFYWREVESMWRKIEKNYSENKVTKDCYYKIAAQDGKIWTLRGSDELEEVGRRFEGHILEKKLPRTIAAYEASETLILGPLTVNAQQVSNGYETVKWDDVMKLRIWSEYVFIDASEPQHSFGVPIDQVTNLCLLEALLRHIEDSKPILIRGMEAEPIRKQIALKRERHVRRKRSARKHSKIDNYIL